ncbi:hypothetical protein ABTM01_19720, partial [Acinetobacter baumannii]
MRRCLRLVSVIGLLLALSAETVVAQPTGTIAITDDRGVRVEVPAIPQRIAAISYLGVDVALALGVMPVATTYMAPGRDPDFMLGL